VIEAKGDTVSAAITADKSALSTVVRRRWRIILACVVMGGAAAVAFSHLQQPQYTASSLVLFQNTQFDQKLFGYPVSVPPADPASVGATNIELASLPILASDTAAALHVSPSQVTSAVSVSGVGQANVAQINATGPDAALAARIATTYAQQYVLFRQQADRATIANGQALVEKDLQSLTPAQRAGVEGQTLSDRANQLAQLATLQTGDAQVVQPAAIPTSPSAPNTKRTGILGVLLGLLLGVGLAFVAERFDRYVRTTAELEEIYGEPVLGAVPKSRAVARAGTEPLPAAEAGAFSLLRSRLRYFNLDRDVRSLLITSASPGDGKTTFALNLAIAEAVAGGANVVLVEADFRRPTLANRLHVDPAPGLAEILTHNTTLDGGSHQVHVPRAHNGNGPTPGFTLIPAGALPSSPAELLESRAMTDLITTLSERFDLIILDTPPTSILPDALPLIRLVSGVVVVSRMGVTTRNAAHHVRDHLRRLNAPTLGVIANATSSPTEGYGHHYHRVEADRAPVSADSQAAVADPPFTVGLRGERALRGERVWVSSQYERSRPG
jgi:capsular exopolysaccharide synthesis family protein